MLRHPDKATRDVRGPNLGHTTISWLLVPSSHKQIALPSLASLFSMLSRCHRLLKGAREGLLKGKACDHLLSANFGHPPYQHFILPDLHNSCTNYAFVTIPFTDEEAEGG